MKLLWSLPVMVVACYAQSNSAIQRQGQYWVQTTTGSVASLPKGRFQLETAGSVVVRGDNSSQITYRLQKRVRANSEAEAQIQLKAISMKTRIVADAVRLDVEVPRRTQSVLNLEVSVPRGLRQAHIHTNWGSLEVYDIEGEVEAATGGGLLRVDRIGKSLVARSGGGETHVGSVSGPVRALSAGGPIRIDKAAGETRIETGGGDLTVREVGGPLFLTSGGGNIMVVRAESTVNAQTAGGVIEVQEAAGTVNAQNSGGGIHVASAKGVQCESNAGTIRVRSVSGALNAITAVGNIFAEFASNRALESILATGSGDVTVLIPSNIAVTVRANNQSGSRVARIVSEFPEIRVSPASLNIAVAEGAINGGGPLLRISTSNGTIYLRRQK
jgi:hypothetical protein